MHHSYFLFGGWGTITFDYCSSKFEVSSLCSHGDMSKSIPGSPILNVCKKHKNCYMYVHYMWRSVYAVYYKSVASVSWTLYMYVATRLTSELSKYSVLEATKQIFM